MNGPIEEIAGAIAALEVAGDALFAAADMFSDSACDRWADVGGVGAPPKAKNTTELYEMSDQIVKLLGRLAEIEEGLK